MSHMSRRDATLLAAAAAVLCVVAVAALCARIGVRRYRRRRARRAHVVSAAAARVRHETRLAPATPVGVLADDDRRTVVRRVVWNRVLPGVATAAANGAPALTVHGADWTRFLHPGSPVRVGAQYFQVVDDGGAGGVDASTFRYDAESDTTHVPLATTSQWVNVSTNEAFQTTGGVVVGPPRGALLVGFTTSDLDRIDYRGPTAGMVGHWRGDQWTQGKALSAAAACLPLDRDAEGVAHAP